MIAAVIITVKLSGTNQQYDMELPADVPMKELLPQLLTALKNIERELFLGVSRIMMKFDAEDRYLKDGEALESAGVWDGSIVTVERCV